jgi:hypothetical protein
MLTHICNPSYLGGKFGMITVHGQPRQKKSYKGTCPPPCPHIPTSIKPVLVANACDHSYARVNRPQAKHKTLPEQ